MGKRKANESLESHKHLCDSCNEIFECTDVEDADLEIATCPACKSKPKKEKKKK